MISGGDELYVNSESNGAVTSEKIGALTFTYDTSKKVEDTTLYQQINTLLRGLYRDKSKKNIVIGGVLRA